MEITDVRVALRNEEKLRAFVNITFDNCFIVHGLKVIKGKNGHFVSMPSRKRKNGSYQDIAHPITDEMRDKIEQKTLDVFEKRLNEKYGYAEVHRQEKNKEQHKHKE